MTMTVSQWCSEWQELYAKPSMTNTSYKQCTRLLDKYFLPQLGNKALNGLLPMDIQKCANSLAQMSNSQISKAQIVLGSLIKKAAANNLANKDILQDVVWPGGYAGERRALTPKERDWCMEAIQEHPRGLLFAWMYGCGLRPGEARALLWQDVDFDKKQLNVCRAIKKDTKQPGAPKSKAGNRIMPIPPWLIDMALNAPQNGSHTVSGRNNKHLNNDCYRRAWLSLKRMMYIKAGVSLYRNEIVMAEAKNTSVYELTPYHLRHNYCTLMAENGVLLKTAQYLMGHSNIAITAKIYTHVSPIMIDDARGKIDDMFNPE